MMKYSIELKERLTRHTPVIVLHDKWTTESNKLPLYIFFFWNTDILPSWWLYIFHFCLIRPKELQLFLQAPFHIFLQESVSLPFLPLCEGATCFNFILYCLSYKRYSDPAAFYWTQASGWVITRGVIVHVFGFCLSRTSTEQIQLFSTLTHRSVQ